MLSDMAGRLLGVAVRNADMYALATSPSTARPAMEFLPSLVCSMAAIRLGSKLTIGAILEHTV